VTKAVKASIIQAHLDNTNLASHFDNDIGILVRRHGNGIRCVKVIADRGWKS